MQKQWIPGKSCCRAIAALSLGSVIAAFQVAQSIPGALAATWNYELTHNEDGVPMRALARLRGESASALWLACTKIEAGTHEAPVFLMTVTVSQKQILGVSNPLGRSTVYWFDDEAPELEYWRYFKYYGQLSNPDGVETFIDKLTKSRRIVIDLSNYRYETRSVEFVSDPGETRSIVERLRRDCRRT